MESNNKIKEAFETILNENQKLTNQINELALQKSEFEKKNKELEEQLNEFSKQFTEYKNNNDKIIEGYYENFNRLFLMFNLETKGALKNTHIMCLELLDFVVNICEKYDLTYWLDYGNLLGAIRHNGFIPWDDDIDIGMLRKDFDIFLDVINNEIEKTGLSDFFKVTVTKKYTLKNNREDIIPFIQVLYLPDPKHLLAGLDVFIYDYIPEITDDLEKNFYDEKIKYHKLCVGGTDRDTALESYKNTLKISSQEEKYIIPGIENARSKWGRYKFSYYKTEDIFPLRKLRFNDRYYYCPNKPEAYLKSIYGNYHNIPRSLGNHKRLYNLFKDYNVDKIFEEHIQKLQEVNENF